MLTTPLAHGGTGGLIVELVLLVGIVLLGALVWWRSRRTPEASAADDEARVEQ